VKKSSRIINAYVTHYCIILVSLEGYFRFSTKCLVVSSIWLSPSIDSYLQLSIDVATNLHGTIIVLSCRPQQRLSGMPPIHCPGHECPANENGAS